MSYVKDDSGIVINTDDSQYRSILALRESKKRETRLQAEVSTLKDEMSEIKNLLAQLVHRNN